MPPNRPDNAPSCRPIQPVPRVRTTLPPKCRYVAVRKVRIPITHSGGMAINGQSYTAAAGQNPMSTHIDFSKVRLREAQQPPLEAAGTRIGVSKGVCCLST